MNKVIASIISQINTITKKNNAIYQKRVDRIELAYKEANGMIAPNIDSNGRFHAPCHGYCIPNIKLDFYDFTKSYSNILFSQGEFIPLPVDDEYSWFSYKSRKTFSFKSRILIKNEIIDLLKEIDCTDKPFLLGFGNSWIKNDDTFCYLYLSSCWKSIVSVFESSINVVEKKTAPLVKEKGIAPTGEKIVVKAKVISISLRYNGYNQPCYKLFVEFNNGSTAYGTLPSKISDVEKGQFIEFKATFVHAGNDKTHSFYKSPSSVSILKDVESFESIIGI